MNGHARRIVARAAATVAVAVSSGCVSYKPVPPLDDPERTELAALSPRLATERIRVVAAHERAAEDTDDMAAAVRLAGATVDEITPSLTVEMQQAWVSLEEPVLGVLTLGVVPCPGAGRRRYQWRLVAEDGRQIAGDVSVASPHWMGWLVGPMALLPGWELTATWDKETQEREEHSDARRERLALGLARSVARLRDAAASAAR